MADSNRKATFPDRATVVSFILWLVDKWQGIAALASGGAIYHLASITTWLEPYGPVGWGAAAIGAALIVYVVLAGGYAVYGWGKLSLGQAKLVEASARAPSNFNRLQREYIRQTIRLSDLIHPVGAPLTGKIFIECEIVGPGLLILSNSTMSIKGGRSIELIRLHTPTGAEWPNKAFLQRCDLTDCALINVVVAMTADSADELIKQSGGKIPVLE